jgi:hypothetical protein
MRAASLGSMAMPIRGSSSSSFAKSVRLIARHRTGGARLDPSVPRMVRQERDLAEELAGLQLALTAVGQLDRDGPLLQDEHARARLTDLDEHVAGGRLELRRELRDPGERAIAELGEQRDRPERLDVHRAGRYLTVDGSGGAGL